MTRLITCLLLALMFCAAAFAQSTEAVLYRFAGPPDGSYPSGGLLFDSVGDIYGTTVGGGSHCPSNGGCGTVYELSPASDGYTETILYDFCSTDDPYTCPDGAEPWGGVISDHAGNLYGTTSLGGHKYGTVFELSPRTAPGGPWTETVLWEFGLEKGDGLGPDEGKLNFDAAGNLYGTTTAGGAHGHGTVFELSPIVGGGWSETVLLSFSGADGSAPLYGVAIDAAGNLYGTTSLGGVANDYFEDGCGTVFELTHLGPSGWAERLLYKPTGANGAHPSSNISIDLDGNLYGTLEYGGDVGCYANAGCGGIFRLAPGGGGGIARSSFLFNGQGDNGGNPWSGVLIDENALFGTTDWGNNVYEVKDKIETVLYQFCSQPNCADGSGPLAGTIVSRGKLLYGVTAQGGELNNGVVYSLTK